MGMAPVVGITQKPALIGIDGDLGKYSIVQRPAEVTLRTVPGELTIRQYRPELQIDSTRAREALSGGAFSSVLSRIYSGVQQLYLEGIARRMEQGSRLVAIHIPSNTIANIIGTDNLPISFPETRGPASMDNVDVSFNVRPPDISVTRARSEMEVQVNKPEIQYTRGKLDVYMRQYPSVQFIPPEIDTVR
ncbi:hypothetical protein SAMN05444162_2774 [Paenibacillaceae bacterium GAS479]|nr:hypothetical protein SAMN05444162_2774 [Paenibacillaceae bacterium GAS479]